MGGAVTYFVALPFLWSDDCELVPGEARERPTAGAAVREARRITFTAAGAVAFSRIGDLESETQSNRSRERRGLMFAASPLSEDGKRIPDICLIARLGQFRSGSARALLVMRSDHLASYKLSRYVVEVEQSHISELEKAATMANHASTRTTQLYDRRNEDMTLDKVERVMI